MFSKVFALTAVAVALSACSTPGYRCPVGDENRANGECSSIEKTYETARAAERAGAKGMTVFDPKVAAEIEKSKNVPVLPGAASAYPETPVNGMPVFEQPRVYRVWIPPYVDAEGNLRSGEYSYFSTPGRWNYGTMKKEGAGSALMEPTKPNSLGFTPEVVEPKNQRGVRQSARTGTAKDNVPAEQAQPVQNQQQGQPAESSNVNGITQPYQRLN